MQGLMLRTGDVTDGTEDGRFVIFNQYSGTLRNMLNATGTETIFNDDSQNVDFRVESDGNTHMLFVDGGSNHVNVGTSTDHGAVLNVESTDNAITLLLASTDTDANAGPQLKLLRAVTGADNDICGQIEFGAKDDAGNGEAYAIISQKILTAANGSEEGRLTFKNMEGGSQRDVLSLDASEVVINEDSRDIDFRVESDGNQDMFIVNAGDNRVGIANAPDLGAGLHIKTGDSGASVNSGFDELVIEGSGNSGISILSGNTSGGAIIFGDDGDNDIGNIFYDHNVNNMVFNVNATEALRISTSQVLSTGGETGPDTTNGGITIDTNAEDGLALSFKNSDVAHGITTQAQADTYGQVRKLSNTAGGLILKGYAEGEQPLQLQGIAESANTTKSTSGEGIVAVTAYIRGSGGTSTNSVDPGSDANLFVVNQGGNAKFIVDTEGQLHSDGGAQSAYDTYEDAHLVRAYDLSHGKGVIDSKFDKFISYNHEKLADMKLVGREEDGTPNNFINITGMQRLHNGAIWQQYEKTEKLTMAMYELAKEAIGEEKAKKILEKHEVKLLS